MSELAHFFDFDLDMSIGNTSVAVEMTGSIATLLLATLRASITSELSREPPKLILRFGEPLCDFTATRYAPVHKFHLANRTLLEARTLGVSLIVRRT